MFERIDLAALRSCAQQAVCVKLRDGHEYEGRLRTELLTDRSVSVYLDCGKGEGVTLYIEQIAAMWKVSKSS